MPYALILTASEHHSIESIVTTGKITFVCLKWSNLSTISGSLSHHGMAWHVLRQWMEEETRCEFVEYRICECISRTFWQEFTVQNWGSAYTRNWKKNLDPPGKSRYPKTTEPMTPVLYVVKPPVETVSSRHHLLSIDSQKSEDRNITDKLP
jgi:hypothetical protein